MNLRTSHILIAALLTLVGGAQAQTFTSINDIDYAGTGNPRQALNLILPTAPVAGPLPVVVFIHGGGWSGGSRAAGINQLRTVLGNRFIGVSVGYRLSGEAIWPAQIHDCKAAIRWIRANANLAGIPGLPTGYGPGGVTMNADRIGVWGTSAGGHLVTMLGVSSGVAAMEGTVGPNLVQSSAVTCVADYFGPSDLLSMSSFPGSINHDAPNSPESRLVGGPLQQNAAAATSASPTNYVTADDAAFLIVHGDKDPLVPYQQSVLLRDLLVAEGVSVRFTKMVTAGHGGFQNAELTTRLNAFFDFQLRSAGPEAEVGPLPNGTDGDGDLMLDSWETANSLNPADPADAGLDKDGDGQTNLAEFLAETDPCDRDSGFKIREVRFSGTDSLITFPAVDDRIYRIYGTANFRTWFLIHRNFLGPEGGGDAIVTASGIHGSAHARRFYRVEVE